MTKINEAKILIVATDGFQEEELFSPHEHLSGEGAEVHLASLSLDEISAGKEDSRKIKPDLLINEAKSQDYDAIVLPGGLGNPDKLRTEESVKLLVRNFAEEGKVIAAICHAPWILISADIVKGREMTSYPSIQDDLRNAGAQWVDKEVVVSNGIITSRSPDDLKAFNAKIIEEIREGRHDRSIGEAA